MPHVVRLPDWLHGARLDRFTKKVGENVAAGETVAIVVGESHTAIAAGVDGVVRHHLVDRDGAGWPAGTPIAIVGEANEDVGWPRMSVQCVRLTIFRTCEACSSEYPINALASEVHCVRCGEVEAASPAFWSAVLRPAIAKARQAGADVREVIEGDRVHGKLRVEARGIPCLCNKCSALVPWEGFTAARQTALTKGSATLFCGECGEGYAVRPPPQWALGVVPDLSLLVGEIARSTIAESKPVVFACPSCSASLQVDGTKRIVRCRFCESDVYLPDELWLHMNPAAKRARWWMVLRPNA
jgi:hypothetical protein